MHTPFIDFFDILWYFMNRFEHRSRLGVRGYDMSFELWLFAVKQLAQTYEVSCSIYEQLSDAEKRKLRMEYTAETGITLPEDAPPKVKEERIDLRQYDPVRMAETMRCEKLCFQINHTMPDTEEYNALIRELLGSSIGEGSVIHAPIYVTLADHIRIGKHVSIMNDFKCMSAGGLVIEDNVQISYNCTIATNAHDFRERRIIVCKPVVIRKNALIGVNVTILPGVTIGTNAVIGAGSVVTRDIPDNSIAVGVPARVVRSL